MTRALMMMTASLLSVAASWAGVEEHSDVVLLVEGGRIVTGVEEAGEVVVGARVFGSDFGETIAHLTDEPGFDAFEGTFPQGSGVGFDILDALWRWDEGAGAFVLPAETLFVGLGAAQRTTPVMPATVAPGFTFAAIGASGAMHQHLNMFLNVPQGDGVYLYVFRLTQTSPAIGDSAPVYFVLNEGMDEGVHEAAMGFVEGSLSDPGCPGDATSDGVVDFGDLNEVLNAWGASGPVGLGGDVTLDGRTDFADLDAVLAAWGDVCP